MIKDERSGAVRQDGGGDVGGVGGDCDGDGDGDGLGWRESSLAGIDAADERCEDCGFGECVTRGRD